MKKLICILLGLVIIVLIGAGCNTEPVPEPEPEPIVEDDYDWIKKNIGDEIELATLKFKIIGTEEKQIISCEIIGGSSLGAPKVAKEGTKFVIVDLELTNITSTPFYFSNSNGFAILDDRERMFFEYNDTWYLDNYLTGDLSPDITERGIFVYEIPQDAESYKIIIRKAGTNDAYEVLLK